MRAIFQQEPGGKLYIKDIKVPEPGPGEVLVKMSFSPVNPSDLSLLKGTYAGRPDYPLIPGIEGSGRVVKSGRGFLAGLRKGKRVACIASAGRGGTWSEYMLTPARHTIPLDKNIGDEQGAMLLVNPLTALAFVETAKRMGQQSIVNNAAAGALGKMLISLCLKNNIKPVNIVARKSQLDQLKNLGAEYVLLSSAPGFDQELKNISEELRAKLFFDAVGGREAETMLRMSPHGSTIISYGKLSEQDIKIDPRILIQQDKQIRGFYLAKHSSAKSILQNLAGVRKIKNLLSNDLKINVVRKYPLEKINEAIEDYRENMSAGKVLICLNKSS
ncbi:MAG: zinc-binding dehydrogenase [Bacteroidales bacterium]|nr:zinc-binding dehydrogenase [Bacteroidales bacterium]